MGTLGENIMSSGLTVYKLISKGSNYILDLGV